MGEKEVFVKIPIGLYRDLMGELRGKAEKDRDHAIYNLKKIDEIRKKIRAYNKEIWKDADGN